MTDTTGSELSELGRDELVARVEVAERDAADYREKISRSDRQIRAVRDELERCRVRVGQLERQLAGYNDDEFDPGKQKGIGAIPIGGDFSEVERIEEKLFGMSPTLDQQMRALGISSGVEQAKHLLEAADDGELVAEIVAASDQEAQLPKALQALWKCRSVLQEAACVQHQPLHDLAIEALAAIAALPVALFEAHLQLASWDETGLPEIRS